MGIDMGPASRDHGLRARKGGEHCEEAIAGTGTEFWFPIHWLESAAQTSGCVVLCYREDMSAKAMLSIEEYLHTLFEGSDREYLDGEVVERKRGNKSPGRVQGTFVYLLRVLAKRTGFFVMPEVRHRISQRRYRSPDVAVFASEPAAAEVPDQPPLIAIDILSPDHRIGYIVPKLDEYGQWGVENIWVADAEDRKLFVYRGDGRHEVEQLEIAGLGMVLSKVDVFG
jgi:Uma2 family endonuclease